MDEIAIDAWRDALDVMTRFVGSWSFDRVIEGQATMRGIAVFTPLDTERLVYREQGDLTLANGTALQAEREYIFASRDGGFEVFFKENPPRLFHVISLSASLRGEPSGSAGHLCNRDYYQSTYSFLADGRFVIRHVVSGPRKDYTMVTTYTRLAAPVTARARKSQPG
ncbi:DUF6314 family protein [Bradyrhizobium commune]|uniref:DUF6314 domain-containing protein n=1 Tax=Bradyrhizobium commune TaxID=83627 RepID=A0A7S9D7L1_9BRAD|nr:DUF6314 family protein [Bradyrhizobium commune]QPF92636.1 hypothetical protein IC761_04935 [Bradyrhizobium commune]